MIYEEHGATTATAITEQDESVDYMHIYIYYHYERRNDAKEHWETFKTNRLG